MLPITHGRSIQTPLQAIIRNIARTPHRKKLPDAIATSFTHIDPDRLGTITFWMATPGGGFERYTLAEEIAGGYKHLLAMLAEACLALEAYGAGSLPAPYESNRATIGKLHAYCTSVKGMGRLRGMLNQHKAFDLHAELIAPQVIVAEGTLTLEAGGAA